jgi:uncharacterized protein involved in type VI secretion and phage assembly
MTATTQFLGTSLDRRYYGVVVGIVTNNKDTAHQGRVKLKFPWYDNATETDWCRVACINAGPQHGFFAIPEEQTEVVVAFEHGDMRRPYVLGALFNGVDAPPTDRREDNQKDEKLFQTHQGHRLLLRDTVGDTLIEFESKTGQTLTLRDQGQSGSAAIVAKTSQGHRLELDDGSRKVTLKSTSGHTLELDDASNQVKLTNASGQGIVIDATGNVTITGAMKVHVNAPSVELGPAAAQHVILGEAFMALFNMHTHALPPVLGGSTLMPVVPMTNGVLSQVTKTT